ncbi:MAG: tRNA pseudouridine(13) synthase TruD [Halioglobus sp.]
MLQAERWARRPTRVSRARKSLYLSALRASLFNRLLAVRVRDGSWNRLCAGDQCMLAGSRSFFTPDLQADDLQARLAAGDIHPGLPLWGRAGRSAEPLPEHFYSQLGDLAPVGAFLEGAGLELAWRPTRLLPDDFSWQFCDDGALQLDFTLGAGSYATALLAELVRYREGDANTGADGHRDRGSIKSDRHREQG